MDYNLSFTQIINKLKKLCIGTVQFGLPYGINNQFGIPSDLELKEIFNYAIDSGVSFLDTANAYGNAQLKIGEFSKNRFNIIGKFSAVNSINELHVELKSTLNQLKTHTLYGYLAHNADNLISNPDLWNVLKEAKADNKINKIGYSLYTTLQLEKLLDINLIPDLVQLPYSLLDRKFEPYFEYLNKLGTEIHVRSVFLQGLYFMNPLNLPSKLESLRPALLNLNDLCKEYHIDMNTLALNFPLSNPLIDKVVIGIDTLSQLKKNIEAVQSWKYEATLMNGLKDIYVENQELLNPANW